MKHKLTWSLMPVALAVCAAFPAPAMADTTQDLLNELRALKARVGELEKKIEAQAAKSADAPVAAAPGMTPEQQQDFNRIAVKTEAMEDARDALGFKGLKISGYMDPTFIYNQRQHRAGFQFLNQISDDGFNYDNSFFGAAVIDFTKETDSGSRWRLTLAPNRGIGTGLDGSSPIHEASVSIPLTDLQTRLIAGQIPDWSGYEYLPATQNKLITHNLLSDFTLPFAYTGAGLELAREKWLIKGVMANMNASRRNVNEKAPVFAYRVDYAKGEFQGFGFAGVHGKAANLRTPLDADGNPDINPVSGEVYSGKDTRIDLFEVDGYFIRGDWTVQGQFSAGRQQDTAIALNLDTREPQPAQWWGLSGLVAYKFEPRIEGTARLDYLSNRKHGGGLLGYVADDGRNGIGRDARLGCDVDPSVEGCSRGVNRAALTLGLGYVFNLNTTFRFEYRYDWASSPVFKDTKSDSYKKSNQLLGTSVLVSF